jgi:murein DD-endopeptidase MepM/ murein hydrolase activator NlpD
MRRTILIAFISLSTCALFAQNESRNRTLCNSINELNNKILNGSIKKADAAKQFSQLIRELGENFPIDDNTSWVFPLKGYNYRAIGGTNGNGYSDKGYNYLDGNKHAAHPAHDIFIRDKNQDCIDDRTHKPVDVLSVADGIVIACADQWEPGSAMRGGKYIWIFHPSQQLFTYYAHNQSIFVKPGDVVKQGQKIAEVGRTGFNAYKKRSPTHLHFSAFHLINGLPIPYNPYLQLTKAENK